MLRFLDKALSDITEVIWNACNIENQRTVYTQREAWSLSIHVYAELGEVNRYVDRFVREMENVASSKTMPMRSVVNNQLQKLRYAVSSFSQRAIKIVALSGFSKKMHENDLMVPLAGLKSVGSGSMVNLLPVTCPIVLKVNNELSTEIWYPTEMPTRGLSQLARLYYEEVRWISEDQSKISEQIRQEVQAKVQCKFLDITAQPFPDGMMGKLKEQLERISITRRKFAESMGTLYPIDRMLSEEM
jgi:hypothetical protein